MSFQKAAGAVVWSLLIVSNWIHAQFIAPSLNWWIGA